MGQRRLSRLATAGGLALGFVIGVPWAVPAGPPGHPPLPGPAKAQAQPVVAASAAAPPGAAAARVTIPAGEFWMGRTRLWLMDEIGWQIRERADDRPVHRVRLQAFALDAHEVTNADYAAFVATARPPVEAPYHWGGATPHQGKQRLPVYNVTWHDAVRYCAAHGGRLPTEAEWEYAARGSVEDLDYPWGNDYTETMAGGQVVRRAHSGSSTGPVAVGSYPANALGLYDVSGNVWEWTADWYDLHYYSESPVDGPRAGNGPLQGDSRRQWGRWRNAPRHCVLPQLHGAGHGAAHHRLPVHRAGSGHALTRYMPCIGSSALPP